MRSLQGLSDPGIDQSMGRKAARMARKPHVVGSIALDQRLRDAGGDPGDDGWNNPADWVFVRGYARIDMGGGNFVTHGVVEILSTGLVRFGDDTETGFSQIGGPIVFPVIPLIAAEGQPSNARRVYTSEQAGDLRKTILNVGPAPALMNGESSPPGVWSPGRSEPEPTASFPWDAMTGHAEIDGWAEAQGVDCGGSGWDRMTLAGKREWLVAYFDGARPWETGN
jgi:hypothetical protein